MCRGNISDCTACRCGLLHSRPRCSTGSEKHGRDHLLLDTGCSAKNCSVIVQSSATGRELKARSASAGSSETRSACEANWRFFSRRYRLHLPTDRQLVATRANAAAWRRQRPSEIDVPGGSGRIALEHERIKGRPERPVPSGSTTSPQIGPGHVRRRNARAARGRKPGATSLYSHAGPFQESGLRSKN